MYRVVGNYMLYYVRVSPPYPKSTIGVVGPVGRRVGMK
jgi:hypothetical protein